MADEIKLSDKLFMKKQNIFITFAILFSFGIAAYVANIFTDKNYMFLLRGDGTPYDILFNLVGGHPVIYPLGVIGLFVVYISLRDTIYFSNFLNVKLIASFAYLSVNIFGIIDFAYH